MDSPELDRRKDRSNQRYRGRINIVLNSKLTIMFPFYEYNL